MERKKKKERNGEWSMRLWPQAVVLNWLDK